MSSLRLRHTARALLLDLDERLLLARHDLRSRHIGQVIWAPPGGGLEAGETPAVAVVRELLEEVGYLATAGNLRHVWHQEVVSAAYAKEWDGAIHDYFVVRCDPFTPKRDSAAHLVASEGITGFQWWTLKEMLDVRDPETFRPRDLPALFRDLLGEGVDTYPLEI